MRTRTLGTSGLEFTAVGLGTWAIGGGDWRFGWGAQDEGDALAAIRRAVELGVNWIDTAAVYGNGRSEELVGRALAGLPAGDRPLVATKCSRVIQPDGTIESHLESESIRGECEASLRRLRVDAIDLYQLHWPDPAPDIEAGWQTLVDLQREGKVRHIGVCNFRREHLERIAPLGSIASLQPPYSMLRREIERDLLDYCRGQGIGVVGYSPMAKGLLSGRFSLVRRAALDPVDHRTKDPDFTSPRLEVHLQLVEGLRAIADAAGKPVAHLAIAWTLRRPEVTSAIVGARSPQQIEETAGAADWVLSADQIDAIDALLDDHAAALEPRA